MNGILYGHGHVFVCTACPSMWFNRCRLIGLTAEQLVHQADAVTIVDKMAQRGAGLRKILLERGHITTHGTTVNAQTMHPKHEAGKQP
eukprot:6464713-Amphidinium_carterae.1